MSVEIIRNLGDDALENLFEMSIGPIAFITDLQSTLLRIQGFTIPATGITTYDVHYQTQKITKPNGKIDAPNEFDFTFRVDRNWTIYRGFKNWKNAIANSATGIIANDGVLNPFRVPVTVWPIDSDGQKVENFGQWTFTGCFVQKIGDIGFQYSSGEPLTTTVTMGFAKFDDNLI